MSIPIAIYKKVIEATCGTRELFFFQTGTNYLENLKGFILERSTQGNNSYFHMSGEVSKNPQKMISKGWKLIENPFEKLSALLIADANDALNTKGDYSPESVLELIKSYAAEIDKINKYSILPL